MHFIFHSLNLDLGGKKKKNTFLNIESHSCSLREQTCWGYKGKKDTDDVREFHKGMHKVPQEEGRPHLE